MNKIKEGLYEYKGVQVILLYTGKYVATVYVNDLNIPITITDVTQKGFMKSFNRVVSENGGLKL